jgi:hypothetical protein
MRSISRCVTTPPAVGQHPRHHRGTAGFDRPEGRQQVLDLQWSGHTGGRKTSQNGELVRQRNVAGYAATTTATVTAPRPWFLRKGSHPYSGVPDRETFGHKRNQVRQSAGIPIVRRQPDSLATEGRRMKTAHDQRGICSDSVLHRRCVGGVLAPG